MTAVENGVPGVAWLSSGRLFVKRSGHELQEIESDFARETMERRLRSEQLHGWKNRSGVWGSMGMAPPELSQWDEAAAAPRRSIQFRGLTRGDQPGELFYVLDLGDVGGLFRYDMEKGYETRLMHKEGFVTSEISRHPTGGDIAASVRRSDGTSGIIIGENDGRFLKDVTFSDGVDESPAWLPDGSRRVLFQSAAWMRDNNGIAHSLSTYRIEMLDLESNKVDTIHEQEEFDLLQPRQLEDGTLYFVRRPYRTKPPQRPLIEDLKDIILFPYRLILAFFHFLNFFAVMFSGKPLSTAGGRERPESDVPRQMMLWGHMIDTKHLMKKQKEGQQASLVPDDWKLIRRTSDGSETTIGEAVFAFDVTNDGRVLYTDGTRVTLIESDGSQSMIAEDRFIDGVALLG